MRQMGKVKINEANKRLIWNKNNVSARLRERDVKMWKCNKKKLRDFFLVLLFMINKIVVLSKF